MLLGQSMLVVTWVSVSPHSACLIPLRRGSVPPGWTDRGRNLRRAELAQDSV